MQHLHQFRRSLIKPLVVTPVDDVMTVLVLVMGSFSYLTVRLIPLRVKKMFLEHGGNPPEFQAFIFYDGVDPIPSHFSVELMPGWAANGLNITHRGSDWQCPEFLLRYINWMRDLRRKIIREEYSKDGRAEWQRFQEEFLEVDPGYALMCDSQDVMFRDMVDIYHALLDDGSLDPKPRIDYYAEYGLDRDNFF